MRIGVRSMGVIVIALACHACGGSADPQPQAQAATSGTAAAAAEFGVAECDDYVKKYLACIDRLAPAAQAQARQALEQSRTSWKQAAATDQGKAALAMTCKAAIDTAAPAMQAQGCSW